MVFCLVGGQVDMVAYIKNYVDQTQIVSLNDQTRVLSIFWLFVSVGRILGLVDQKYIKNDEMLTRHLAYCCILGTSFILLVILYPTTTIVFWVSIAGYAFFYAPTVAFCHDLNNRLTLPTEKSTAICFFGLNVGASFIPFITAILYKWNDKNPIILMVFIMFSMLLPLPIALYTRSLSYKGASTSGSSGTSGSGTTDVKIIIPESEFMLKRHISLFESDSVQKVSFKSIANAIISINRMKLFSSAGKSSSRENGVSSGSRSTGGSGSDSVGMRVTAAQAVISGYQSKAATTSDDHMTAAAAAAGTV